MGPAALDKDATASYVTAVREYRLDKSRPRAARRMARRPSGGACRPLAPAAHGPSDPRRRPPTLRTGPLRRGRRGRAPGSGGHVYRAPRPEGPLPPPRPHGERGRALARARRVRRHGPVARLAGPAAPLGPPLQPRELLPPALHRARRAEAAPEARHLPVRAPARRRLRGAPPPR